MEKKTTGAPSLINLAWHINQLDQGSSPPWAAAHYWAIAYLELGPRVVGLSIRAQLNLSEWQANVHAHMCTAQLVQVVLAHMRTGHCSCDPVLLPPAGPPSHKDWGVLN